MSDGKKFYLDLMGTVDDLHSLLLAIFLHLILTWLSLLGHFYIYKGLQFLPKVIETMVCWESASYPGYFLTWNTTLLTISLSNVS